MQWPEFDRREKITLIIAVFFCILFGIRYYPGHWEKTLYESVRWIFGFFFYAGTLTYMLHGLLRKMFKRTFSLKVGIKITIWLALSFSISQSLHEILKLPPSQGFGH